MLTKMASAKTLWRPSCATSLSSGVRRRRTQVCVSLAEQIACQAAAQRVKRRHRETKSVLHRRRRGHPLTSAGEHEPHQTRTKALFGSRNPRAARRNREDVFLPFGEAERARAH